MADVFSCLSLTLLITFLLFILSCQILLIPDTVKLAFATFVPRNVDMPKAISSPVTSFDLSTKPKLNHLTFHIQEYSIPGKNVSTPIYPLYDKNRNVIWVGIL